MFKSLGVVTRPLDTPTVQSTHEMIQPVSRSQNNPNCNQTIRYKEIEPQRTQKHVKLIWADPS